MRLGYPIKLAKEEAWGSPSWDAPLGWNEMWPSWSQMQHFCNQGCPKLGNPEEKDAVPRSPLPTESKAISLSLVGRTNSFPSVRWWKMENRQGMWRRKSHKWAHSAPCTGYLGGLTLWAAQSDSGDPSPSNGLKHHSSKSFKFHFTH